MLRLIKWLKTKWRKKEEIIVTPSDELSSMTAAEDMIARLQKVYQKGPYYVTRIQLSGLWWFYVCQETAKAPLLIDRTPLGARAMSRVDTLYQRWVEKQVRDLPIV